MAITLESLLRPKCGLVMVEVQQGMIGDLADCVAQ